jgi:hypothetical protein
MRWTDANAGRFWRRFRLAARASRWIVPGINFRIAANRAQSAAPAKNGVWTVMNTGAIGGSGWGGASIANVVNLPTMIQVTEDPHAVKGNGAYRFFSAHKRFSDRDGRTCAVSRQ